VSAWEAPGRAQGLEEGVVAREQELASRRELWWLGRWQRNVERRGEGQREVGSGGEVLGRHVARGKAARGRPVRGTWPARAGGGGRAEKTEERRLEVDEGGPVFNFPKVQGLLRNAELTFKP
jgi:hypothetical protein